MWVRLRRARSRAAAASFHDEPEDSMIKLVFTFRRRAGISLEEFHRYWHNEHAELVSQHADALRIRRYVQTRASNHELDAVLARAARRQRQRIRTARNGGAARRRATFHRPAELAHLAGAGERRDTAALAGPTRGL